MSMSSTANPAQRIELTPRQQDVVRLIERGLTNAEIAERMGVTLDGVKWHVREILGKFGVESREDAVECWRSQERLTRRVRHWGAGLWTSTAARWAGGLALGAGAGVVGVAAVVNSLTADNNEIAVAPPPALVVPKPDLATNEGLTLVIERVEADDTQTVVTFSLEGRPDLGRFASPALGFGPDAMKLVDEHGREYQSRGGAGFDTPSGRRQALEFDPVDPGSKQLFLTISDAKFVNAASEVPEGQRPPDPSAVVAGPWTAPITEFQQPASVHIPIGGAPQPFGPGQIVLDEIVQASSGTWVQLRLVGWDSALVESFIPRFSLTDSDGRTALPTGGGWGNDDDAAVISQRFERLSGPIAFNVGAIDMPALTDADIERSITNNQMTAEQAAGFREFQAGRRAANEALAVAFANQPPATWTFTLP